jgi:hypothetical protein
MRYVSGLISTQMLPCMLLQPGLTAIACLEWWLLGCAGLVYASWCHHSG